jgi:hypothetical protein
MPRTIFISHCSDAKREAIRFKELLWKASGEKPETELRLFLSSDWDSLKSGRPWFEPLIEEVQSSQDTFVLITDERHFTNPWINFEVGMALGKKDGSPKIFVFGGIPWDNLTYPLRGLHLIATGDSSRWVRHIRDAVAPANAEAFNEELVQKFGCLFRQSSVRKPTCFPECQAPIEQK